MTLVTGATGFIGINLIERMVADGRPVRCLVRRSSPVDRLPKGVDLAYGDLASGSGLPEAVRGCDAVIHLAGVTKGRNASDYFTGNARAAANMADAARDVRRFVHVSSLAAAGPSTAGCPVTENMPAHPVSTYGRSKLAGEESVRESGVWNRTIVIRPPVVYGPRDTDVFQLIQSVSRGFMARIGSADRRFSFVYVGDLVTALLAAADDTGAGGRIYFASSSDPVSWDEFGATVARLMSRKARTLTVPESAAYVLGMGAEAWSRITGKPGILSRDKVVEACCEGWVCDTTCAQRELGFRATTTLEAGLRRTLDWYKEAGWLKF